MDISKELEAFVGSFVRVSICPDSLTRTIFAPQMSVSGKLEKHPNRDEYRVLVDDNNYTYFKSDNVVGCVPQATEDEYPTQNTIFINIVQAREFEQYENVDFSYERVLLMRGSKEAVALIPFLRDRWMQLQESQNV